MTFDIHLQLFEVVEAMFPLGGQIQEINKEHAEIV
jgi:hypothetical protein